MYNLDFLLLTKLSGLYKSGICHRIFTVILYREKINKIGRHLHLIHFSFSLLSSVAWEAVRSQGDQQTGPW